MDILPGVGHDLAEVKKIATKRVSRFRKHM